MARIAGNVCNTYIHIDLLVEEISTSIENNTSTVTWSLVGYMGSGGTSAQWYSNSYHTINVNINGKSVYSLANTTQKAISIGTNATQSNPTVIASGTTTVPHNEDGTKNCACSFSVVYRYSSAFSWSGSGNVALTNIARATVPKLSVSSAVLGDKVTISLPRASASYTHSISYKITSTVSGMAGGGSFGSGIGTSYEWTVPESLGQYFANENSTTVIFTVTTYNGSKQVGTPQTATLKVNVPDYTPTISSVNISDPTGYYTTYGGYVQGKSKANVTMAASGKYGSVIRLYMVKIEKGYNSEFSSITTDVLLNSGTTTATIKVVDSRGKVATVTKNITVLPYAAPVIASFNAYRCKSATDSTVDDMGEYIAVSHSTSVSSLNSKNTKTVTVEYRQAGTTQWNTLSGSIFTASSDKRWEVRLTVTDKFESTVAVREVSVAYTLMDFNASGKGMAIGKVSEGDNFDVNMEAMFRKGLDVSNPNFPTLNLTRSGVPYYAGFKFNNSLGVLGALGMSEVNGALTRFASDLTTKYDLLDTKNYSKHIAFLPQGYRVARIQAGGGSSGYWKFATITMASNTNYCDGVITFEVVQRTGTGNIYLQITNGAVGTSFNISIFKQTGGLKQCYIIESSKGVFDLYLQKELAWGNTDIVDLHFPTQMRQFSTIAWKDEFVSSVPSGATKAKVGNDWTSYGTASGTSASVALNAGSSYLFTVSTTSSMEAAFMVLAKTNGAFNLVKLYAAGTMNASLSGTTLTISAGSSTTINYKFIELK